MNLQPDFNQIEDAVERNMIQVAWQTLTVENIEFLRNYSVPENTGYLWDRSPVIQKIMERIEQAYPGHSGASLAYTLRIIQRLILDL